MKSDSDPGEIGRSNYDARRKTSSRPPSMGKCDDLLMRAGLYEGGEQIPLTACFQDIDFVNRRKSRVSLSRTNRE